MKRKKKNRKTPDKPVDFTLEDIINAPKPKVSGSSAGVSGCTFCGGLRFIFTGQVRVFRGERMKVYHCHECGKDFYKGE